MALKPRRRWRYLLFSARLHKQLLLLRSPYTAAPGCNGHDSRTASGVFNISGYVIEYLSAHYIPVVRGLSLQSLCAGEICCDGPRIVSQESKKNLSTETKRTRLSLRMISSDIVFSMLADIDCPIRLLRACCWTKRAAICAMQSYHDQTSFSKYIFDAITELELRRARARFKLK